MLDPRGNAVQDDLYFSQTFLERGKPLEPSDVVNIINALSYIMYKIDLIERVLSKENGVGFLKEDE